VDPARSPATSGRTNNAVSWVAKAAAFTVLLVVASQVDEWVLGVLGFHLSPATEPLLHQIIMLAIAAYIVLMVIPFCPGIEIGLGLMMVFGADIVPLVYGATVVALLLAFLAGRHLPASTIINGFDRLRMHRARDLIARLEPLDREARLALLRGSSKRRWIDALLRCRYVALGLALNTPGNIVLGDGGGIALAAGFSRLFTLRAFLLTIVIAVSPAPIAIALGFG
jgi:hypothetical protein